MNRLLRFLGMAALAVASAGASPGPAFAQSVPKPGFVRLEAIEPGAPQNDPPAQLAAGDLRNALAAIRLKDSLLGKGSALFDDQELSELVPAVASALDKAGRSEDVTFALLGRHGVFGERSPATVTTGRVFVQGGHLNLILGQVHQQYENLQLGTGAPIELKPGRRTRTRGPLAQVTAATAIAVDGRSDWLRFDTTQLAQLAQPAAAAPRAPAERAPQAASPDDRYPEIQMRLKTLERLRADGLVTEEEYRERRRAIVQSL